MTARFEQLRGMLPKELVDYFLAEEKGDPTSGILPTPTQVTYYVREDGDDNNDGLSERNAFYSWDRLCQEIRTNTQNLIQRIDITGKTITLDDGQLLFPLVNNGYNPNINLNGAPGPKNYFLDRPMQLVAEPELVQSITVSNNAVDGTTKHVTLTVDETLTPDAHVGQFVIGAGIYEHGTIVTNDANTILIACDEKTFTGPVGIYKPGAEVIGGDPSNFYMRAAQLITGNTGWFISGIKFSSTEDSKSTGLDVFGPGSIAFQQCQFTGLRVEGVATGHSPTFDACYIFEQGGNGASFTLRGCHNSGVLFRHSLVHNCNIEWETPWVFVFGCWFEACDDPVGRQHGAGVFLEFQKFQINNAPGVGLRSRWRGRTTATQGRINNSGSHAVELLGGTVHSINVEGTGNGGFGISVRHGAQCDVGSSTVTGSSGDIELGAAGATAYGSVPADDLGAANPEMVRVF